MRRKKLISLLFILLVAGGGLVGTLAAGNSPELGLDLQGGVSVVLEATGDASDEALDQSVEIIRERVDGLGVAEPDITRQGDAVVVQLPGVKNRDRAIELVGQTAELRFRPVLADLTGMVPAPEGGDGAGDEGGGDAPSDDGSTSTTTGDDTSTTEGALDSGAGGTAGLPLGESAAGVQQQPTTTEAPDETTTTEGEGESEGEGEPPAVPGLTDREDDKADETVVLADDDGGVYQLGPTMATGRVVETASATIPQGQWMVELTMRSGKDGIDLFNQAAAACFNRTAECPTGRLAIVLDSVVQSSPNINAPSYSRDQIVIEGEFTESEAKDLALVLRYGSLPVELERQTVQTVSASLGEDSLRAGIVAGIAGLVIVALYMILYYRALGVVVVAGFAVWAALMYTIVSWLGETQGLALTLAGVTGMIMSIGVTVDSYVVFFERLKDDVAAGRTLRSTTDRSFKRAFRTILAANMTSFIGAGVLWWLTVGSVRGFALFLGLSTVLGVVVTWFFTRPVVSWLSTNRVFTEMPVLGVARGLTGRRPSREAAAVSGGTGR